MADGVELAAIIIILNIFIFLTFDIQLIHSNTFEDFNRTACIIAFMRDRIIWNVFGIITISPDLGPRWA